jgi:hypothetical protein
MGVVAGCFVEDDVDEQDGSEERDRSEPDPPAGTVGVV